MQNLFLVWLALSVSLVIIALAGARRSRYGNVIAKKSGLGRGGVGLILLATVTSLPERATGLSAVSLAKAPDIAVVGLVLRPASRVFRTVNWISLLLLIIYLLNSLFLYLHGN